jgi:flagellar biosynthesis anti-sigma factor FlgM
MKIEGNNAFVRLETLFKNAKAQRNSGPGSSSGAKPESPYADKVVLSPQARELQELRQKLNALPDVREQQVVAIGSQIRNGQYQRSSERAASALMNEALLGDV